MVYGDGVYGGCGPYGADCSPAPLPFNPEHCDICAERWRFEATDLRTGIVKAVLHPINATWEEQYSKPGVGSMLVATLDPSADDIWPHSTGLYISRVNPDGSREGHWGGYVEAFQASSGGATNIGLQSIDDYLNHRLLATEDAGLAYSTPGYVPSPDGGTTPIVPGTGLPQTTIAKQLVEIALAGNGQIPLIPIDRGSTKIRVRHWDAWEFKNIGEAIQQLTEVGGEGGGVTYKLEHRFFENPGRWVTEMIFSDELNVNRNVVLRSDYEAWGYGLSVDAQRQATRIYGVGFGEGTSQMFSVAVDEAASLPEFQATLAWKDVKLPATLDDHTVGAVTQFRDPTSNPSMVVVGLESPAPPPEELQVGDIVEAEIAYGLITFKGDGDEAKLARLTAQTYRVSAEDAVSRTLVLTPLIRPSLSIKTQVPAKAPPPETPEQGANPPAMTPIAAPAPQYPAQVLDLSIWKLTLPTGSSGSPDEIKQPKLATYSHPDLFHTVTGPGVLFKAPQDGVTTPNSQNTRTELREMKPGGTSNASWSSGKMEAELAFTHLPSSKPHVVGMQVHDANDDVSVLRLEGTDLWITNGDNTHGKKIMSGYQLGTKITVRLEVGGGDVRWFLNGVQAHLIGKNVSGGYFKAGAYQQAGHSGSDYGEVIIYKLKVTH